MARTPAPPQKNPEYMAAMKAVLRIQSYWASKGFVVNAWAEPGEYVPALRCTSYSVKTDLVNGMPRGVSQRFISA